MQATNLSYFLMDIIQNFLHLLPVPFWILKLFIVTSLRYLALLTIQPKPQGI